MTDSQFSYKVFFERTFDPIALYRVNGGNSRYPGSADKVIYVDVNPAYEQVMNVRRKDVIGRSFLEIWPRTEPHWSQIIINCLRLGHTVHCEGDSQNTHGYLEAIAFPLPPRMAAVIFLDRTEWKTSDDALKRKQEELRSLATQLTLSEEVTRRAIAADLHDRVGYALVSQLQRLRRLQDGELPAAVRSEIETLTADTEKLIAESRELIFELSPPILREVGLNPALEALAENLLSPRGIKWEIKSRGAMAEFAADDSVCVILYRMTRELLINVIKHSGAKHAKVIVNRGVGKIMVAVEDDGHGFPPDFELDSCVSKSFGLFSIRERLAPVGGELKIVSVPGEGATVAMSCPLHLKEGGLNR